MGGKLVSLVLKQMSVRAGLEEALCTDFNICVSKKRKENCVSYLRLIIESLQRWSYNTTGG